MVLALSSENYAYGQLFVVLLTASFKLDTLSMNLEKNANYVYNQLCKYIHLHQYLIKDYYDLPERQKLY